MCFATRVSPSFAACYIGVSDSKALCLCSIRPVKPCMVICCADRSELTSAYCDFCCSATSETRAPRISSTRPCQDCLGRVDSGRWRHSAASCAICCSPSYYNGVRNFLASSNSLVIICAELCRRAAAGCDIVSINTYYWGLVATASCSLGLVGCSLDHKL